MLYNGPRPWRAALDVAEVVDDLASSLRGETVAEMRRAFAAWIRDVLLPVRSTGSIEWQADLESLEDLQVMLRERVIQWTQEWKAEGLQEGRIQGRAEGRTEGRAEGERRVLRRLLERRYGSLPERWARALAEAGEDDLLRWSERILDAESLDEVFA